MFSVLICTYNRHEMLQTALRALIDKSVEKPDEVIIVNGGDERADQVVAEFQGRDRICVKLIKTINKNLASSRNIGLAASTGEIVAMTDDDAEVYPDWVTQMKRIHAEHPEAGAVGGLIVGANSDHDLLSRLSDIVTFPPTSGPGYVNTLPGVNVSYKRDALTRVGKQDETLFRGEDVDFNWRIGKAGYRVYYHPDIKVLHHHRPTLRRFLNQHYMYGRAYYLVRRKWSDMYCVYPRAVRRPRDLLKALNFVAAAGYEPFLDALKLPRGIDKPLAFPILLANQIAWRSGMIRQKWIELRRNS